jgi:tryptophan-rich sensory protein
MQNEHPQPSYTTAARTASQPRRPPRRFGRGAVGGLLAFLGVSFAVAAFGSVTTIGSVNGWYAHAGHVAWTPPNWVFGAVWSVLYTMIAVAGWLVWMQRSSRDVRVPLSLFVAQFVLNALWTPVFFGGYEFLGDAALWAAAVIIITLDLLLAATVAAFWPVSRAAALLLVPYLLWVLYASTLNWGDAALNALA